MSEAVNKKSVRGIAERLKELRKRRPSEKFVDEFNELMRKDDEEAAKKAQKEKLKKIAKTHDPEQGL